MFTGIIEEMGKVKSLHKTAKSAEIHIQAEKVLEDVKIGDSIAVNGVCLTVVTFDKSGFTADVMNETFRRSNLKLLHSGQKVNLERAMKAGGRFGGHMVAGHIDGTGVIQASWQEENAIWFRIRSTPEILKFIVQKGSIAIDGISLTVAEAGVDSFLVSVIPHTIKETTLGQRKAGDTVNLENDCIGKYVEKLLYR